MSDATNQQLDDGFRHHVHAYSGLGYDAMVLALGEYFAGQHQLLHDPKLQGRFKCESPRCPGYPYTAEYLAHPIGTCAPKAS